MPNQRDDGFNQDQDDIFASDDDPMNETFDNNRDRSVVDLDDDDITDISDYDDNEEGIFAPPPQKKKSASPKLLAAVGAIALLGAGGFAVYSGVFSSNKSSMPAPVSTDTTAVVTPPSGGTGTDIQPLAQTDTDLASLPQPQPIMNVTDTESVPMSSDQSGTSDMPVSADVSATPVPDAAVAIPVPEAAVAAAPAMPAPTTLGEAQTAAPAPEKLSEPAPGEALPAEIGTVDSAQPPVAVLAAPPTPSTSPSQDRPQPSTDVTMNDPVISPDLEAAPKVVPETVYYDAPQGKTIESIPTPSLDPKRGKKGNESIIVVSSAITATNQDSSVAAANRALRLGRYETALEMFDDLYRANPRDGRILMGRAVALQKLGRHGAAVEAYEDALSVDPENPEALVNLMGLIRKQYPARALEKLLDLRATYPDNPGIMAQLGVAYADSGNLEDAAKYLMMASKAEPENPQHYFNLGVIAERMKNRSRAIAFYEKALEIDAVYGNGRGVSRDTIYDRLARLRS